LVWILILLLHLKTIKEFKIDKKIKSP